MKPEQDTSAMVEQAGAFQNKGGIEKMFGERNRMAVIDVMEHDIETVPENPEKSRQALKYRPLHSSDPDVRVMPNGHLYMQTVVPSSDGSGQLFERWSEWRSIASAINSLNEYIVIPYGRGGEERALRETVARRTSANIKRFQEGPLTNAELSQMNEATIKDLVDARFKDSVIPERREAADLLIRSTEPDSMGRVNPPKSRMQANAATPRNIGQLTLDDVKHDKAVDRSLLLLARTDYVDAIFGRLAGMAEKALRARVGTGAFEKDEEKFRRSVAELLSPRSGIAIVQPYLTEATIIRHDLLSKKEPSDIWKVGKLAGFGVANRICTKDFVPYANLTDPQDRKRRIAEASRRLVGTVVRVREEIEGNIEKIVPDAKKTKQEMFWEKVDGLKVEDY